MWRSLAMRVPVDVSQDAEQTQARMGGAHATDPDPQSSSSASSHQHQGAEGPQAPPVANARPRGSSIRSSSSSAASVRPNPSNDNNSRGTQGANSQENSSGSSSSSRAGQGYRPHGAAQTLPERLQQGVIQAWNADDGNCIGKLSLALRWAQLVYEEGKQDGYYINPDKCII